MLGSAGGVRCRAAASHSKRKRPAIRGLFGDVTATARALHIHPQSVRYHGFDAATRLARRPERIQLPKVVVREERRGDDGGCIEKTYALEDAHNAESHSSSTQEVSTRFCCLCNTRAPQTGPMSNSCLPLQARRASYRVASGPQRWMHDRPGCFRTGRRSRGRRPCRPGRRGQGRRTSSRLAPSLGRAPTALPRARPWRRAGVSDDLRQTPAWDDLRACCRTGRGRP